MTGKLLPARVGEELRDWVAVGMLAVVSRSGRRMRAIGTGRDLRGFDIQRHGHGVSSAALSPQTSAYREV